MRNIRIPYHLGQPQNEMMGKVNPAILYRKELDPEKQTITHELDGLKLLGDQVWKFMKYKLRKIQDSNAYVCN